MRTCHGKQPPRPADALSHHLSLHAACTAKKPAAASPTKVLGGHLVVLLVVTIVAAATCAALVWVSVDAMDVSSNEDDAIVHTTAGGILPPHPSSRGGRDEAPIAQQRQRAVPGGRPSVLSSVPPPLSSPKKLVEGLRCLRMQRPPEILRY